MESGKAEYFRPKESVKTSTSDHLVVPETNFSQQVPLLEPTVKCSLVISGSCRVPNMFLVSVTWSNLLRPSYDWEVLTHLTDEFDHCLV